MHKMQTYLRGHLTESTRVKGLLLRRDKGTTGRIVQVKDKVLDGVGKHFVAHGWGLLWLFRVVLLWVVVA